MAFPLHDLVDFCRLALLSTSWHCGAVTLDLTQPQSSSLQRPSQSSLVTSGFVESTHAGKAKYDSKKHALVWKIKRFNGATEHTLIASVELIATTRDKKAWSRPPISMNFQVTI